MSSWYLANNLPYLPPYCPVLPLLPVSWSGELFPSEGTDPESTDGFRYPTHPGIPQPPSGNRCGHDPREPRWFEPPEKHAPRPAILRKLSDKLQAYYRNPATILPSLNLANGSDRQQRSERREACLDLLGGFIHYLDLVTLRVGIPGDEGFRGITMVRLAELAGLTLRRAERACRDLVAAGIVGVHPIAQQSGPEEFTGLPAIRTVTGSLFKAFGLHSWLRHERDKAVRRRRRHHREQKDEAIGRMELVMKAAEAKANQKKPEQPAEEKTGRVSETSREHARSAVADMRSILKGPMSPP
jgi:hypothetical protein